MKTAVLLILTAAAACAQVASCTLTGTVTDPSSTTLASATVSITSGFQSAEDFLFFLNANATTFGNISSSYNASTGVLTLTSSGATATLAQWQAALRVVGYFRKL